MEATVLNPVQQHLLKFFAFDGSEEKLLEVKTVLTNYFSQKLDKRLDELWDSRGFNQEKLDELGFLARLQEYEPVDFWSSKA